MKKPYLLALLAPLFIVTGLSGCRTIIEDPHGPGRIIIDSGRGGGHYSGNTANANGHNHGGNAHGKCHRHGRIVRHCHR